MLLIGIILGVEAEEIPTSLPTHFVLEQNYPNPFNPTTHIRYQLPRGVRVLLNIYNLLGQKVRTLADEFQPAGYYDIEFRAEGLVSGVYFYRLQVENFYETKKLILAKVAKVQNLLFSPN